MSLNVIFNVKSYGVTSRYSFYYNLRAFTEDEINEIRGTTFKDVILSATNIPADSLQENVFVWNDGIDIYIFKIYNTNLQLRIFQNSMFIILEFYFTGDPCPQPKQLKTSDLQECTSHRDFDYFAGSEVAYIMAFTSLGLFPFGMLV